MTEFSYDADLAGLSYNLVPHTTGFLVAMHGYNDRMLVLAEEIQKRIKTMKIKPERLAVIKESVRAAYSFLTNFNWPRNSFFRNRYNVIGKTFSLGKAILYLIFMEDMPSLTSSGQWRKNSRNYPVRD